MEGYDGFDHIGRKDGWLARERGIAGFGYFIHVSSCIKGIFRASADWTDKADANQTTQSFSSLHFRQNKSSLFKRLDGLTVEVKLSYKAQSLIPNCTESPTGFENLL